MSQASPSFDLVVATVSRSRELGDFLDSLEAQSYPGVRVIVVDQNDDERVAEVIAGRRLPVLHRRSVLGLSRARNVGLREVEADLVAFPDDDCIYPPGILGRVAASFVDDPGLDGLTGRTEDSAGATSASWKHDPALLTEDNHWNRANAASIFLRSELVGSIGEFDERMGLGSSEPWSSGEETDYLIRALRAGARIRYDPGIVIEHDVSADDARVGYRDGASVGYLLRKHRYSRRVVARMLVRPAGGALLAVARRDPARARYYVASVRGRLSGYLFANRSKSSA